MGHGLELPTSKAPGIFELRFPALRVTWEPAQTHFGGEHVLFWAGTSLELLSLRVPHLMLKRVNVAVHSQK